MIINFIHWNVNPEIISGSFIAVRWYGLLFALSFIVGYFIMFKIFKHENLTQKTLDTLSTYMVIATIIGARLGHVLFYEPASYLKNPLDILKIWEGGLASHGAAIGILLALYMFSKREKKSYHWILDRIVIVVALAGFFIRMGNLMNSEIYGKPSFLPWAFIFVRDDLIPRHPTQIYEGLSYLLSFFILYKLYWKANGKPRPWMLFGLFLIFIFGTRFFIEFLKEPQVGFESGMFLNMGQWLSIPFILTGIWLLFKKPQTDEAIGVRK